jgi:hypothetical protein
MMSTRRRPDPAQLVVACFSRHVGALDWAEQQLIASFGPLASRSPDYDFHHTKYYTKTMGADLKKRLLVFAQLRPANVLADVKNFTIGLESDLACRGVYPEERPLNLDPGLLQLGKLVLASTKDQSHRTFLRDGIYVENTLRFQGKCFVVWPWTYADYREPAVLEFLAQARGVLHDQLLQLRKSGESAQNS